MIQVTTVPTTALAQGEGFVVWGAPVVPWHSGHIHGGICPGCLAATVRLHRNPNYVAALARADAEREQDYHNAVDVTQFVAQLRARQRPLPDDCYDHRHGDACEGGCDDD